MSSQFLDKYISGKVFKYILRKSKYNFFRNNSLSLDIIKRNNPSFITAKTCINVNGSAVNFNCKFLLFQ